MKTEEKQELVRLLHLYQADLMKKNTENVKKKDYIHWGIKAQYEHARIIATKLSCEVGKEIKSYWEL